MSRRVAALVWPVITAALAGCPPSDERTANGPTGDDQPAAPTKTATTSAPPAKPVVFRPLPSGKSCLYTVTDVMSDTLGDTTAGAHKIEVTYELEGRGDDSAPIVLAAKVLHVKAKARREDYEAELDSSQPGDMTRIRGGADTMVMPDVVVPFVLVDQTIVLKLDERGRLQGVDGGETVRKAFVKLHPPAPRKKKHYQAKAAALLSDDALGRLFLPAGGIVPSEGPLMPGAKTHGEVQVDLDVLRGKGAEAFRARLHKGMLLLERKRTFGPSDKAPKVPPLPEAPEASLLQGSDNTTVELSPGDPCFQRAGWSQSLSLRWKGILNGVEQEAVRQQVRTRLWANKTPSGSRPNPRAPVE